tara:strand:+ start:311 stop:571 length:261 start_codon:yes stop_codon:yes gene_type:complete
VIAVDETKIVGLGVKPISNAPQFRNFAFPYNAIRPVLFRSDDTGFASKLNQAPILKRGQSSSTVFEYHSAKGTQRLYLVLTSQDGG